MTLRSAIAGLIAALPAVLGAQAGSITGIVVARPSGEPLAYGIVGLEGTSRAVFTSDSGRFTLRDMQPGKYRISAKRLGYKPAEIAVEVRAGVTDTVAFVLERLAVTLASVDVKAYPACTAPGAPPATDTVLAPIVSQLKLNSEQVRLLSRLYPHEYTLEIRRDRLRVDSAIVPDSIRLTKYPSKTKGSYRPGEVLRRENRNYVFQIPELQDIADPRFIAEHCWHYGGVETIDERAHFRVDVVASSFIRGVDIDGSFLIDAKTFQIRRSIVRLSRRPEEVRALLFFETTTDYREIVPSVPIIAHVRAVQKIDPRSRTGFLEIVEEQHTFAFYFTGPKPGDPQPPKP